MKIDGQKLRERVIFLLSLGLSLWLLADGTWLTLLEPGDILALLPALMMTVLAFTLLFLRRRDAPACLLALTLMVLAILARDSTVGLDALSTAPLTSPTHGHVNFQMVHIVWILTLGAAPLLFAWAYTRAETGVSSLQRTLRHGGILIVGAVVQSLCILAAHAGERGLSAIHVMAVRLDSPYHQLLLYAIPGLLAHYFAAFWHLLRHYRTTRTDRNQTVMLILGAAVFYIASVVLSDTIISLATCIFANLAACLVSLLLVYALERYALFGFRISIRRVVQYNFAKQVLTVMTFGPLLALAFLLGLSLNTGSVLPAGLQAPHYAMLTHGPIICGVLGGVFALMLAIRIPLLRWLDRSYFHDVYDIRRATDELGRSLRALREPREVARRALEGVDAILHPQNALLLSEENGILLCLARRSYSGYRPPLWPDVALLRLEKPHEIVAIPGNQIPERDTWVETLPSSAKKLLDDAAIQLAVPIREEQRTTGVLLLSAKESGADYSPEESEILAALGIQIADALRNARISQESLRHGTRELTARSLGFVELVEQERMLLAADLHDQTLPELRCLLTDLERAAHTVSPASAENASGEETRNLEEMVGHLRQTITNIRDIMENLRPSALEMLGLLPSLESELRKATARARPRLIPQFQVLEETLPPGLSSFAEVSLFRIHQEAVNNACRHAGASKVRVQVGVEDSEWFLRIDDDGEGLPDIESRHQGYGLETMQYRAGLIGARLTWGKPDWENGTRVEIRLPLKLRHTPEQERHEE